MPMVYAIAAAFRIPPLPPDIHSSYVHKHKKPTLLLAPSLAPGPKGTVGHLRLPHQAEALVATIYVGVLALCSIRCYLIHRTYEGSSLLYTLGIIMLCLHICVPPPPPAALLLPYWDSRTPWTARAGVAVIPLPASHQSESSCSRSPFTSLKTSFMRSALPLTVTLCTAVAWWVNDIVSLTPGASRSSWRTR